MTSNHDLGSGLTGMQCNRSYIRLTQADEYVINDVLNAVAEYASLSQMCPVLTYEIPSVDKCEDADSFGTLWRRNHLC